MAKQKTFDFGAELIGSRSKSQVDSSASMTGVLKNTRRSDLLD